MTKAFETFRIKASLTGELSSLEDLAYNLRWAWHPETIDLFRRLDPDLWNETRHNPVKMLGLISQDKLSRAASDDAFVASLKRVYKNLVDYMSAPTWFGNKYGVFESPNIAYFSMEFGLTECLPVYSGGLGVRSRGSPEIGQRSRFAIGWNRAIVSAGLFSTISERRWMAAGKISL